MSMSATLSVDGLTELRAALAATPDRFRAMLAPMVREMVAGLAAEVVDTYPLGPPGRRTPPGNLKAGVRTAAGRSELSGLVRSTAPHAHLYERGTALRRRASDGAARGRMPAHRVIIPAAIQWRADLTERAKREFSQLQIPGVDGRPEVREL
jgi:hypothetical protein